MSNDIVPMKSIQDSIRDKIKGEFVNLIPDDAWNAMVAGVVKEFTTPVRVTRDGSYIEQSPIQGLIRDEFTTLARAHLKTELDRLAANHWGAMGQQVASDAIKKLIEDNYADILASVQAGSVQYAVMMATNNMRNAMQNIR